jgi:hypothetical protein
MKPITDYHGKCKPVKYTQEITNKLIKQYQEGIEVGAIAAMMTIEHGEPIPERSIIAKLSSLGVYKKKEYLTKRGEVPIKKEEYIERIAQLLDVSAEILESLEKVNKSVLQLLERKLLEAPKLQKPVTVTDLDQNYFLEVQYAQQLIENVKKPYEFVK